MNTQQIFVLISTFVIGMLSGAYMYATSFAPTYVHTDTVSSQGEFSVTGEKFGGCRRGGASCDSFAVFADRSYRYLPGSQDGSAALIEGELSRSTFSQLKKVMLAADYKALNTAGSECRSARDLIDYRYEVTIDEVRYTLNTCSTQFTDSLEQQLLLELWQLVAGKDSGVATESEFQGAAGALINRFGE